MAAPDRVTLSYYAAIRDFRRARRRALLQDVVARLKGHSRDLLSYDEVQQALRGDRQPERRREEIPLDAIVGSVGRYNDFTRDFLPRRETDAERWARVKVAMTELGGVPPIEVYRLGDVYFVLDGNHRVSVARQLGQETIAANVTEIRAPLQLTPDDSPDEAIIKARHAVFMERCGLDEVRPDHGLRVTAPGQYRVLEEHIARHRRWMAQQGNGADISPHQAAADWFDTVYLPVVETIRERGILYHFPDRTETDLYVWLAQHRDALQQSLGWDIQLDEAAEHLAAARSPHRTLARAREWLLRRIRPRRLEPGPRPGQWRQSRRAAREHEQDRLFREILVAISGTLEGWNVLEQAQAIALEDGSHVRGLHVTPPEASPDDERVREIQAEFTRRCEQAGIEGELAVQSGKIVEAICERVRWCDLVVMHMQHPPGSGPLARLGVGTTALIRACSRPLLIVPWAASPLNRPLLAYDGSPKADEALFIAAYIADRWRRPLTVVTVQGDKHDNRAIARARNYLNSHAIDAAFVSRHGHTGEAIMAAALEHHSDVIVMGGYGRKPVVEVVVGSTVDHVLRESWAPVLVCR